MTQLFSRIVFSRIIAMALLSTMVAAGAGATCLLPAAAAHSSMTGCHSSRIPANPQPADYRCCLRRHPSALLTNTFSPRSPMQGLEASDAIDVPAAASDSGRFPIAITPSGAPPRFTTLRI